MRRVLGLALVSLLAWGGSCDSSDPPPPASTPNPEPEEKAEAGEPSTPKPSPASPAPSDQKAEVPHFLTGDQVETTVDGKGEGPYRFTARWHTNVADNWTTQLAELRGKPGLRYLEIGVFEGRSLLWMFENVLTDPSSRVTAIDVFAGDYEQTFDANIQASGHGDQVTKLEGPSQRELRALSPDSFDIIYIDGSHTADDVLADAVLSWDLLADGGLLIFDDYGWTGRPSGRSLPVELIPRLAVDAFVTSYRNYLEVRHRGYQLFLRKRENPCEPKDYCSPIGQYRYFWRANELRREDGSVVELSDAERELVEIIAISKKIGEVGYSFAPQFREGAQFVALTKRLELEL